MTLKIENIEVVYHDEDSSVSRSLGFRIDPDETTLHIDIIDEVKPSTTISLNRNELELLRDSLNIYLKNKALK